MNNYKTKAYELFLLTLGAAIYAFGVNYFLVANNLAEGGVTGITLILHYLFKLPISSTYLVLNIPLVILGYLKLGKEFIAKTAYGILMVSIFIKLTSGIGAPMDDLLLGSLFGGLVAGSGLGIVFLSGGSTGGMDIVARILTKYRGISVGKSLLAIDILVLSAAGFLFGRIVFMYTLVSLYVASKIIDSVEEGKHVAKSVMVISDKMNCIEKFIINEFERTSTILDGVGSYSGEKRPVLYCVMSKYEIFKFKQFLKYTDPRAFVIVNDVSEVLGEGFRSFKEI